MLIAASLVALYFLFFSGTKDPAEKIFDRVESRIKEHVKDKERRKEAEAVLGEMRKTREGVFAKIEVLSGKLSKAHAGHETPRADTEKILDELDALRRESWAKQLDARFKLRDTLTRDEWAQVFPAPKK
jgi:hypothetical protein